MRRLINLGLALALAACAKPKAREVHLYTWDSYDDPAVFEAFEKKTGMHVVVDYFASNEELLAKLMGGAGGYDVIVPSDYMVGVMRQQGLVSELDFAAIPHIANIDARFRRLPGDPEGKSSVPYLWGLTGIAYDSDKVKPAPDSWAALWDKGRKGRIAMLNDQREVIAMALQSLGRPADSRDPKDLEAVKQKLLAQKPLVKTYSSENQKALLISGEVDLAHAWSGDLNQAAVDKPSLRFALPKEGGIIFQDNMCVPKNAPNRDGALQLIDFLLLPENAVRIIMKVRYGTPNKAVWPLLPEELRKNPSIVPTDAVLKSAAPLKDVGEAAPLYDRLWTELKAG